jgi:hypothetical protein
MNKQALGQLKLSMDRLTLAHDEHYLVLGDCTKLVALLACSLNTGRRATGDGAAHHREQQTEAEGLLSTAHRTAPSWVCSRTVPRVSPLTELQLGCSLTENEHRERDRTPSSVLDR